MVTVTFNTDNAIFEDNPNEMARIFDVLKELSREWHEGGKYVGKIYEYNGNPIGMYIADLT